MAYKLMVVFAVSLTVFLVTVGGIGDVCYEACIQSETQQQECIKGCNDTVGNGTSKATECEYSCVSTGSQCRLRCVASFYPCKKQCKPAEPDIYNCLVICLRDRSEQTLTTPAK